MRKNFREAPTDPIALLRSTKSDFIIEHSIFSFIKSRGPNIPSLYRLT